MTSMGLDCLPMHPKGAASGFSKGRTHPPYRPCPFEADNFPIGPAGSCCSLRGKMVARVLEAVGEADLAARMFQDMPPDEAVAFADELHVAADQLDCAR